MGRYTNAGKSPKKENIYRKMLAWKKAGLGDYSENWMWLTREGMKLSGERYDVLPASGDLNHKYVDAQVRLRIEEKADLIRVIPGREILKANNRKPPGLRDFQICDQIALFTQDTVKVEVELTPKTPSDMRDIIDYYAADDTCNSVWYFTNDKSYGFVRQAVKDHPKFYVAHIHEFGIKELKEIRE